ncbi:hypothetical protein ABC255_08670 [Neobacillus sp. 3P2-tot-E-2]|uniref:hypothetical protein n=1 Tax=Neobacillus sp. 3P2-tot-E-2 TaxID=3132212 RepID=UPI0039A3C41C
MKIQLTRDDIRKMVQDYVNYYFADSNTVVKGIEFMSTKNAGLDVSRIEVDFHNEK